MSRRRRSAVGAAVPALALLLSACGGGGRGGGPDAPPPPLQVALERSTGGAGTTLRIRGLDVRACPLGSSEIRVGGETAPAVLDAEGEVLLLLPLFYDEAARWARPPEGPQDVEVRCGGRLRATLSDAITVTGLAPAPGTTAAIAADYAQVVADLEVVAAAIAPLPGIQQQLLVSAVAAMKALVSGSGADSLPALIEGMSRASPEALALADAVHAASGADEAVASFRLLTGELRRAAADAATPGDGGALAGAAATTSRKPGSQAGPVHAAADFTVDVRYPDDVLAKMMQAHAVLKSFSDDVLSRTATTFGLVGGAFSVALGKIPYKAAVDLTLFVVSNAFRLLVVSALPATLLEIELELAETKLENSEVTTSAIWVRARNEPERVTITDLVATFLTGLGLGGLKDEALAWVRSWKEGIENAVLLLANVFDVEFKAYASAHPEGLAYDMELFPIVPPMNFEGVGTTRRLYVLYPASSSVIAPLADALEWRADEEKWGLATLSVAPAYGAEARMWWGYAYVGGAFGEAYVSSNEVEVQVGELALVLEKRVVVVPEGESRTFGVKLSNAPPEGEFVSVFAARRGGDVDLDVTSEVPVLFDDASWDTFHHVVVAAAQDEDQENGEATVEVWTTVVSSEGLPVTVEEAVTARERDDDLLTFLTSEVTVGVPEGGGATFFVKLTREPPGPVQASVVHAGGDPDLSVEAGSPLHFDTANWDVFQEVSLHARRDPDTVEGVAEIRIHGDVPDVADGIVTAVEREGSEISLAIQGASWVGLEDAESYWAGIAPLHLYAQEGCIERYEGEAPLEYRGFDYWTTGQELPCHVYRVGSMYAEAGATKDCGDPPVVLGGAKLYLDWTDYIVCGDSVRSYPKSGEVKSYAVDLRPENGYVETYVKRVPTPEGADVIEEYYRVELLLPEQP